jgi:hypothetical protein
MVEEVIHLTLAAKSSERVGGRPRLDILKGWSIGVVENQTNRYFFTFSLHWSGGLGLGDMFMGRGDWYRPVREGKPRCGLRAVKISGYSNHSKHLLDRLLAEWKIIRIAGDKFFSGALSLLIGALVSWWR